MNPKWVVSTAVSIISLVFGVRVNVFAQLETYDLSGIVLDDTGDFLVGATVVLEETQSIDFTDVDGGFQLKGLTDGMYNLQITHVGYNTVHRSITIAGRDSTIECILTSTTIDLNEVQVVANPFKSGPIGQSMSVETVDRSFLEKNNANTFVNALQKLPGVNAINTGVGIAKPVIRGMSFNRVIVTDHGVKQEGQQWGADHGLEIDQYTPERIEIIKGPTSLLYGSDGLGGVVNVLRPSLPEAETLNGSFLANFKSNNKLVGTSTMLQGNRAGKMFRFRFSTQDFGDYRVPADSFTYNRFLLPIYDQSLKNTAGRERNLNLMTGVAKDWGDATITVSNFHQKAGFFSGALGIPREYQLTHDGDPRNIDIPRQVTNHFKVIVNSNIYYKKNWLEIDLGYQNNYRREESNPHAHGKGPRPEGILALGLRLQTLSTNVRYHHEIHERLHGTYGFQAQYQQNRREGFEFLLSDFTSGSAGAFIYQEYEMNHTMTVNGGLRFDYGLRDIKQYEEPVYADSVTIIGYDARNENIVRRYSNFSGAMGLSFYPNQHFNAKLNLGSSFRMPSAPELSSNGIHHGTFRHELGDSTLTTERGWQIDLNLIYQNQDLHIDVSPFYNYLRQYIYLGPTSQFSSLPEGGQIYRYSQDNAIFTGFESSIVYDGWKDWHVKSAVEYVYNRNLTTGLALPFTPPLSILGEVEYTLPPSKGIFTNVYFNLFIQHFAAQNQVDRNEKTTPGYTLLNFSSGFDFMVGSQKVSVLCSVQNLADVKYLNHLSRYRLLNLPEQGRNINITLKIPVDLKEGE